MSSCRNDVFANMTEIIWRIEIHTRQLISKNAPVRSQMYFVGCRKLAVAKPDF